MASEIHWRISLDADEDVAIVRIVIDRGRVVEFALHYQALIDGVETEVARYDTCHGHLHVHRMWLDPPNDRVALEHGPREDYTDAVELAKADLHANWKAYRAKMELKR